MKKVLSLVLVLCMVLGMSVSVFAEGEDFASAINNAEDLALIKVKENVSSTANLNISNKKMTIDLGGNTWTINPTAANNNIIKDNSEVIIQNGTIVFDGIHSSANSFFYVENSKITLKNVTMNGKNYSSAYGVIYANGGSAEIIVEDSKLNFENDASSAGGALKTNGDTNKVTVSGSTLNFTNAARGITSGIVTLTDSEINMVGMRHGLNQCNNLEIKNCVINIKDSTGGGMVLATNSNFIVDGHSSITLKDNAEGDIKFEGVGSLTIEGCNGGTVMNMEGTSVGIVNETDKDISELIKVNEECLILDGTKLTFTHDSSKCEEIKKDEPIIVEKEETYKTTIIGSQNGSVKADSKKVTRGEKVTLTVTPDKGYELAALLVIDEDGNERKVTENEDGTFSFRMPEGGVTVEAEFVKIGAVETAPSTEKENPSTGAADFVGAAAALAVVSVMGMAALSLKK